MTNQLTDIQSQIESFLQTNPEPEAVNSLIDLLKEYESERQQQPVKADLAWKEQLPDTFPQHPKDKGLRKKFRRIFDQLNKQGITVRYKRAYSGKDLELWLLTKGEETGRLCWFKGRWEIQGFCFLDEKGNLLNDFADVRVFQKRE